MASRIPLNAILAAAVAFALPIAADAQSKSADLAKQLAIDMTPEGLRIQIMDEEKLPMFATGSSVLNDRARQLLKKVVPVLMKLLKSLG